MKYLLIALLFVSCIEDKIEDNKQLDNAALDLQRTAMWHREYYFLVIKWKPKNADSASYYENKMDSVLGEYQNYMRAYDSLVKIYQTKE